MTAAKSILKRITDRGPDSLWTFDDFADLPQFAVAQALSRLAKKGFLRRVRKGLYYHAKLTALGPSQPSASDVLAKTVGRRPGRQVYSGGTASFQNLGVTTQVPAQYTLIGDVSPRQIRIGGLSARLQRRPVAHLQGATQEDVWILDSLRNLKKVPDATAADAVRGVMTNLATSQRPLKKLLRFGQGEAPRVRAVLGAIAEQLGYRGPETRTLRKSLNPLSKFHLGITSVLPNARSWNIV